MTKRHRFLMLSAVFLSGFWGTSLAAGGAGWSVELLVGSADQSGLFDPATPSANTSGDDTSIAARLTYKINPNFAAEFSYHDYGTATQTVVTPGLTFRDDYDTTGARVGVKGTLPIGNGFFLNARAGAAYVDSKVTTTDITFGGSSSVGDKVTDMYYGVGVEKDIDERYFVGFEYSVFESEFDCPLCVGNEYKLEIENFSISIGFNF